MPPATASTSSRAVPMSTRMEPRHGQTRCSTAARVPPRSRAQCWPSEPELNVSKKLVTHDELLDCFLCRCPRFTTVSRLRRVGAAEYPTRLARNGPYGCARTQGRDDRRRLVFHNSSRASGKTGGLTNAIGQVEAATGIARRSKIASKAPSHLVRKPHFCVGELLVCCPSRANESAMSVLSHW